MTKGKSTGTTARKFAAIAFRSKAIAVS
jgi:hypothetical protein